MTIFERIRARRIELGMSQAALARRLGYKSRASISKIEMGTNNIPYARIDEFASILNTSTAWLMGFEPSVDSQIQDKNYANAIAELQFLKEKLFNGIFSDKIWALDVAIEALQ